MLGIIVGPGHHHLMMIEVFKKEKVHFRYAVYWPSLKVFEVDTDGNETLIYYSWIYSSVSKLLWGMKVRFPFAFQKSFHKDLLYTLYDRLVSSFFEDCKLLVGWSQVSLYSMKKVKENGGKFILEHPMVHANYWNQIIKKEYSKHEKVVSPKSIRSAAMLKRMNKEYELADKINLLSSFARGTFLSENISPDKLIITPLATDIYRSESHQGSMQSDKFVILYVGRLELLKGVQYLLESFRRLNLKKSELWLVGSVQEEFVPFLRKYEGYYQLLGEKTKQELWKIYKQADVVVFPSLLDAFGLVIIESLIANTPIIATTSSAAEDLIENEDQGTIIPPADIAAMQQAILAHYNLNKKRKNKPIRFEVKGYHFTDYHKSLVSNFNL